MRRPLLLAATLIVSCNVAGAQSGQPYAGLEHRPIKALSHQQIEDLRAGRGMGLALAAELNGYPGPSHVLEFGDRLAPKNTSTVTKRDHRNADSTMRPRITAVSEYLSV
ncbi:hypothetical protein FXB41_13685 [Bradyrhizobium canariense]|nr:hypothetical protein [Bradyrhizobium canariense]